MLYICEYVLCLRVCMCITMCLQQSEESFEFPELESQMFGRHHTGAGN